VSLRSSLTVFKNGTSPLRFSAPTPEHFPAVVAKLVQKYGDDGQVKANPRDLEALLRRLRACRYTWDEVQLRDRLNVAWVLWSAPSLPAEHTAFLDAYLNWLETHWSPTQVKRLASSWAEACDPNLSSLRTVAAWLEARLPRLPEPWRSLGTHFDLFSFDRGPHSLANAFLESTESPEAFFERIQLRGRGAAGGLVLEMLIKAAEATEARLAARQDYAARIIALSMHQGTFRPSARDSRTSDRARVARLTLAEALLLPWSKQDPGDATREAIIEHLLRHYGDARLRQAVWEDMRRPARDTMRRWLSAETIEAFFRLMNDMQIENPHQWRRRRKFWMAYLDHIDHAWLVAGRQGAELARRSELSFGRLSGSRSDHCALMITIRGMTIVDWNHAGSVRIWRPDDPRAPALYGGTDGTKYRLQDLTAPADFECRHTGNDQARWQDRVHEEIRRHTGITLRQRDYF
jgi:hypothetical protein